MATKKLDLLDGIFSGDDRLWVNTFQVDLGEKHGELALFETMVYGPGARAGDHMLYTVEEQARVGHDAMLASYGYRRTGLRKWKIFRRLEFTAKGMVNVSRRPTSRKSVWVMASFWAFALLCATTSVILSDGTAWTSWLFMGLELYMLYQCIVGLLWSYNIPGRGRRRGLVP